MKENFLKKNKKYNETHNLSKIKMSSIISSGLGSRIIITLAISVVLWLSAFLTLYTGYDYLRKGIDHAINQDSKDS